MMENEEKSPAKKGSAMNSALKLFLLGGSQLSLKGPIQLWS
jgi:hypothetical protein